MANEEKRDGAAGGGPPIRPEVVEELPGAPRPPLRLGTRFVLRVVLPIALGWWLLDYGMEQVLPHGRLAGHIALWLALLIGLASGAGQLREIWPSGPTVAFLVWLMLGIGIAGWHILSPPPAASDLSDVTIHIVNPQAPAVWLQNVSDVVAENIKRQFALCNLDDPSTISADGGIRFVPIPVEMFDFLRPHQASGTMALLGHPVTTAAVRPGNRLFGWAIVTCPRCARVRMFLVFIEVGQGGWYSEVPEGQTIDTREFVRILPGIAKSPDLNGRLLEIVPLERRIPVASRVAD